MAIVDVFSKRQKALRKGVPDVYEYAQIPDPLRVQIVHILRDLFGHYVKHDKNGCLEAFGDIDSRLSREYGVFSLGTISEIKDQRVINFVLKEPDHERVLDVVEYSFGLYGWYLKAGVGSNRNRHILNKAITELNARFREHSIGYQYENGKIIRVDSQLIHAEVVKPALALLTAPEYAGANAEFLKAFGHYRKGETETKDCLTECLKAFESTMKAICTKRQWTFKPTDAAKALIDVCVKNGLIPQFLQSQLESGIPTIRNRMPGSGHGQGPTVITVPPHYASYILHLTATTIKFLVDSEKALP
jgi:hypothetical protein